MLSEEGGSGYKDSRIKVQRRGEQVCLEGKGTPILAGRQAPEVRQAATSGFDAEEAGSR